MAIKSRKHAPTRFNQHIGAALAVMLLPVAAQAADPAGQSAPASQQTLNEIKVVGSKENDFKAEKASSPKYTEELVNTPQTIVVIKKELIEQQGALTLTDALRNTPGVGTFFLGENGNTNTGDAVYMRGFDSSGSIYVDGVRDVGSISRDVFNIEQIDVLKGPAGTDSGRGSPTGSINLVSKTATMENKFNSLLTVGSGKQKRATADWNRVLDSDTGTALRLNLMTQDSGDPARDEVKNKRWAFAPTVTFGIGKPTRITASYLHVDQDNVPDGGVPTIGLPGYSTPDTITKTNPVIRTFLNGAAKVDPKNFYGSTADYNKVKADMGTLRIDHDFSPTLQIQNTTRYGKTQQDYLLTAFMGSTVNLKTPVATDPSTWTMARSLRTVKDQENTILTNQTVVSAQFDTGVLKHSVVAGAEFTSEKQTNYSYVPASLGTLQDANLYNPNPRDTVTGHNPVRSGAFTEGEVNTQSLYVFDTIKFGDKWLFNGGVRFDHFNTTYDAVALQGAVTAPAVQPLPVGTPIPTHLTLSDTLANGKISAMYKPTPDSSVYALLATSKAPPGVNFALSAGANSAQNPKYDPQETITKEIGTKWDFLKQKLSFSAAVYQTTVKNEVEQDPVIPTIYYQTGKKRVEGLELGVVGEIMPNWLVSAGYTRMNTKVESGKVVTASGVNNLSYTPKQAFTSWTSYTLPFGLKIGGGARYVGEMLRGTDGAVGTPARVDAYWVFDAMASYTVNKNLDLQLNAYNLADKTYVAAINKSGFRYTPGQPRSFSLMANIKF
ncbi:catecholate siderophore receptor Fiu precursor [Janthinobacterium sp. HH104]|uniref:Catecholate siderophore receptor n=1 Tax=Janthinobacterium lividum TaxID=29581 RepID=A0AB38CHA0_9BURK|nr:MULTISPECIES: catecholate siderophore receptor Fiu [Janthinobacterium]MBW3500644.1 catecholate siderophore receptor Fiu [Janthinobacterium sp. NKUCC08_JDC]OEZ84945.1 catecholate siderophore receptor Fiu precursor [Janthinobacterium sp. HH104]SFY33240.1 catecholate siderophore receptor [Janthinobacterium lividum]